jgi:hypothetical protein
MSRRFSPTAWAAALALLALSMMSAPARSEGVSTSNCYGRYTMRSCVHTYRAGRINPHLITVTQSVEDRAAADARDKRWVSLCRPTIQHDRYGMPRYSYAVAGCEFGRLD